jgi:hypothetical protein
MLILAPIMITFDGVFLRLPCVVAAVRRMPQKVYDLVREISRIPHHSFILYGHSFPETATAGSMVYSSIRAQLLEGG